MTFKNYQNRTNNNLKNYLFNIKPIANAKLSQVISYSTLAGGKRFRPILVYLVNNSLGADIKTADSAACAIEFIHIYSLIHDDLPAMDDDDIRHNQPSCHIAYGEAMAILAGDALQTLAFDIIIKDTTLSATQRLDILASLTNHAGISGMVAGQDLDLHCNKDSIDIDYLECSYKYKTASLLRCAATLGAITSNEYDNNLLASFDDMALNIGLAYQIQDDILDITSNDDLLGKNQYSDIANNKITYPSFLGIDKSKKIFLEHYTKAFDIIADMQLKNDNLSKFVLHIKERNF